MTSKQASTFEELIFREEPPSTSIKNGRLTITAPPLVDWWRNPEPVLVNRKDGPLKYRLIDGSRPFECEVWLRSGLVGLYDQACMVLHGGDLSDPKAHWLKTGTETFSERQWINAVVATPFCDVSTVPAPNELSMGAEGDWVYIRLTKELTITGHTILIRWAKSRTPILDRRLSDSEIWNLREVQAFGVDDSGKRSTDCKWAIGVMVSGLMNDAGAVGEFEGFSCRYLDEEER